MYLKFGIVLSLAVTCAWAQSGAANCATTDVKPARAFPVVEIGCGERVSYLGAYLPDGKYQPNSKFGELSDHASQSDGLRPAEVPDWADLHARESIVENYTATAHPERRAKGHSVFAEWRDQLVTLAYGRERAMLAPRFVTSDSTGRAIVSDPAMGAVHVLDENSPFRIAAGKNYRLQSVGAVAVDGDDNIYVADPKAGLVVVFDRDGRYLREIGRFHDGEGLFHQPEALATDRRNQRLYVLDASRDTLFVLDLNGRVLKRAGGRRQESGVTLDRPEAIAVKHDLVLVLDNAGAWVKVYDQELKLQSSFSTNTAEGYAHDVGLDMDAEGNIYLGNLDGITIRIFGPSGQRRGVIGVSGGRRGEFRSPAGLWIDAQDRLYVSEVLNRRVQVFQISRPETPSASPRVPVADMR